MSDCNHLRLKKVKVASFLYYQCENCGDNFRLPEPLVIKFKYPVVSPEPGVAPERGWLIEKLVDGQPRWLTCAWTFGWTDDALNAIRFCRRDDAEQIASMMDNDDIRITEHHSFLYYPAPDEGREK